MIEEIKMPNRNTKFLTILLALLLVATSAGCLFVQVERKGGGVVHTRPCAGPALYVNGVARDAPAAVALEPGRQYTIEARSDSGRTHKVTLRDGEVAGTITVDVLRDGTAAIVDPETGAWYPLNAENVRAVLQGGP